MKIATFCPCCESTDLQSTPAVLMPFVADRVFGWKPANITDKWKLNTIEKGMAYSVCNTLTCQQCGFVFLDMRFDDDEIRRLYSGYRDDEYVRLRDKYEPGYAEINGKIAGRQPRVELIEDFIRPFLSFPFKVLDWGAGTGVNTPFKEEAVLTQFYDIDDDKTNMFYNGYVYDLIVCSEVLEHVPYPAEALAQIRSHMDENTILHIDVPYQDHNKHYWHEHVNYFTPNSIGVLLNRCGFVLIDAKVQKYEPDLIFVACKKG